MSPLPPHDDDDALAAELALGVLEHEARASAEARMAQDADFARRVAAWENRLAPLNDEYAEVPAPNLLPQIEARLFPKPDRRPVWRAWLMGTVYATIAVLGIAGFVLLTPPDALLVTQMATEDAGLSYEARFDGQTLVVSRLAGQPAPPGQVHELWIIAPGAAPVSLGLLENAALTVAYPVPPKGWVLAVTVEPAGGAPGGVPTGPVIVSAEINA
jgi:anti-sigma-K factor RskA